MSKIEWTDETWNPIRARNLESGRVGHFCVHASPGCANCYAERMQPRFGNPIRYAAQDAAKVELFLDETTLFAPNRWKKPRKVFVCSMTDLFYERHNYAQIMKVLGVISQNPRHDFQILTKRTEQMRGFMKWRSDLMGPAPKAVAFSPGEWNGGMMRWPLPNAWFGVSIEDRKRLYRLDDLRECEVSRRFLSLEPLLEDLGELDLSGIDWVIVGGESGPNARPMHPAWVRSIRDQCVAAGVPFFFKQWGAWLPGENIGWYDERDRERGIAPHALHQDGTRGLQRASSAKNYVMWEPDGTLRHGHRTGRDYFKVAAWARRIGKKRAGRELDGRTWDERPC